MLIGTLAAVRRYPIKSLRGVALDSARVEPAGIPGDRSGALFAQQGPREGKPYRGKEHDRLHLLRDGAAAQASAKERGVTVELRRGEHFFDSAPISILVDDWLRELDAHVGYAVEWERFRPNFFVRTDHGNANPAPLEQTLVDAPLQVGTARLRVRSPIERCVTVNYHPRGEAADPRILQFLATQRNAWMGIYCDVLEPGIVRAGDTLICL
ncbi:MAG TPA: MOSC domain-containing protein [Candidatus Cybelea sp.]|nr:MOSC domain-containing protein [Candidatus Cybelea sp.]